jgi:hypothetical protein
MKMLVREIDGGPAIRVPRPPRFQPGGGSEQPLLLFVAPATDIRSWAGVPRKAFDYQHGFQRTLNTGRVNDVIEYFREDPRNISPTSVVVGFTGAVSIEAAVQGEPQGRVEAVRIRVRVPDFAQSSLDELADHALAELRNRLPESIVTEIEGNVEEAFTEAIRLQDEEVVDEAFGIESETAIETEIEPEAEERSYLADFYAQLLGYRRGLLEWPEDGQLREILYSI